MISALATLDTSRQHLAPFVKWAGGKSSLTHHLLRLFPPEMTNYFEPFLGGGALFFALCSRTNRFRAALSDTNEDLINTYKIVRDRPDELVKQLSRFQHEYDHSDNKSEYYYEKRSWRPSDPVSLAARLILLNKTCYNGLYRVNAKGEFNVPFGRYNNPRFFDTENLRAISSALRETHARLEAMKYAEAIKDCSKGDVVYFDPPYQPTSKTSSFTSYTPGGFGEMDQVRLAQTFKQLSKRGCHVILSNSNTLVVRKLYHGYRQQIVEVNRSINSMGSKRRGFTELIVSNG